MLNIRLLVLLSTAACAAQNWPQWGQNPQHSGTASVVGQSAARQIAEITYDPFTAQEEQDSGGDLLAHYQAPLIEGDDLFMEFKTGSWVPCNPPGSGTPAPCGADAWNSQIWGEARYSWVHGRLVHKWKYQSDWKPEPSADGLGGWEPVFHAALAGSFVYVPGASGTIIKLNRADGSVVSRIDPFGTGAANLFVAGPLTADPAGNIYYNAIALDLSGAPGQLRPYSRDVLGAWLVKITPGGAASTAAFSTLIPGAPHANDACLLSFPPAFLPWPPTPDAVPSAAPCGSQRPGLNVAPAIARDGTIYTISRAHLNSYYGYLVAVNPDLSPKWAASLRDRLADGCGTPTLPPNGSPGGCRVGARLGVDPANNQMPAGRVVDDSSSSPVVAPDGSILYGAYTRYNYARGHLFKFGSSGQFLGAYEFGWDITPSVYEHDGTYSIVTKDNHYDVGSYCGGPACPEAPPGPFLMTRLSADLKPEWSFQNKNPLSCARNGNNVLECEADHPGGFEWCVNAPAVDRAGKVYSNSEDGHLYVIGPNGQLESDLFLNLALGAAYTPLSIGPDGRIYAQNNGRLFVIGEPHRIRR